MHDFYMIDAKVEEVARALGILDLGLDKDVTDLSGGQRTKVLMAKLLLEKPDILLLDEPTNYLDVEHIEWLKRYLNEYENAFILISHDIPFINSVVNLIYHMDNKQLNRYVGDYDKFMEVYEMKKSQLEAAYNKQQKEIADLKDFVAVDIQPKTVTLVGEGSALASINSVTLDKIYVEDLVAGLNGPYTYTIKLPAGVTTTDGTTEAVVTVAVNGTTEGTVTVDNINCESVADGLKAEVMEPLEVSLWGSEEAIGNASAADVRVRVDLSGITEEGEYTLPAVVTTSTESGLTVRGSYEVTVHVTKRETPPDNSGASNAAGNNTGT